MKKNENTIYLNLFSDESTANSCWINDKYITNQEIINIVKMFNREIENFISLKKIEKKYMFEIAKNFYKTIRDIKNLFYYYNQQKIDSFKISDEKWFFSLIDKFCDELKFNLNNMKENVAYFNDFKFTVNQNFFITKK